MQRRTLLSALAAAGATTAAPWALAQQAAWPDQPLRWVVPYPAGGGTDVLARTVAEAMRQTLGQQIIVDNRPGASTNIGGQAVATAKPDGYTFMSADNAILAYNEHLFTKLPFNPEKDFTYVGGISRFPLALVVHPSFEAKTVKEFLDYARANPGKLNYASPGNGSPHHLAMEMFKNRTKTFLTHIPYRGPAPAGPLPPPGLPAAIAARPNGDLNKALLNPAVVKRMNDFGMEALPGTPEQLRAMARSESKRWGEIIKAAGVKLD